MKYEGYYYCPYCQKWLKAGSEEIRINHKGLPYHTICGRRLRTRPRKPYRRIEKPTIQAVTSVTTGGRL